MKTLWKIIKYCFGIFVLFLILYGLSVYLYCHFYANSPIYISGKPYLTHLECEQRIKPANKDDLVRILIIEGGGMHGLLPLHILEYLEKKTGRPINELFDVMSGTSTGSIIVTSLSIPDKNRKPKFDVKAVIEKYKTIGVKSLQDHWYQKVFTVNGLFGPMLAGSNIDEIYKENYGKDLRFDQLLGMLIVPAYDIGNAKMEFFKNWETGCNNRPDYYVHEIISASTATPTIFPPVVLRDIQNNYSCAYIDGVIQSNNSLLRIFEITMKYYPNKKYIITLLGTGGSLQEKIAAARAQHWGLVINMKVLEPVWVILCFKLKIN